MVRGKKKSVTVSEGEKVIERQRNAQVTGEVMIRNLGSKRKQKQQTSLCTLCFRPVLHTKTLWPTIWNYNIIVPK